MAWQDSARKVWLSTHDKSTQKSLTTSKERMQRKEFFVYRSLSEGCENGTHGASELH